MPPYQFWSIFLDCRGKSAIRLLLTQRNPMALRSTVPADRFKLVRYEDIVADPTAAFQDLSAFIGVPFEDRIGGDVHGASQEKWRLDPNYTLQLDPAVRQMAAAFGYAPDELANPHQPTRETMAAARPSGKRQFELWRTRLRDRLLRPVYLRVKSTVFRER